MTDKQGTFLHALAERKDVVVGLEESNATKSKASERIEELKQYKDGPDAGTGEQAQPTADNGSSYLEKPQQWATGSEPATDKQQSFIAVPHKRHGGSGQVPEGLRKAEASQKIEELKE